MSALKTRHALAVGSVVAVLFASGGAVGQTPFRSWSAGVVGHAVNDTGPAFELKDFDNWGGGAFLEYRTEPQVSVGLHVGRIGLPAQPGVADSSRCDYALIRASYYVWEGSFTSGLFGGGGLYRIHPGDPVPASPTPEPSEKVLGLTAGVFGSFPLLPRVDLRVEVSYHLLKTTLSHAPLAISVGFERFF
jgi:hypothetical protein